MTTPAEPGRVDPSPRGRRSRRPAWFLLASGLSVLGSTVAPASAGAVAPSPVVSTAAISGLGTVVVAGHRPLYVSVRDTRGRSTCTATCTTIWIPLEVSTRGTHHLGRLHGLATIRRSDGHRQVTIDGRPLYFFRSDHSLAAANGEGIADTWFAVHPNGTAARALVVGSAPTPNLPSAPTTTAPPMTTPSTSRSVPPASGPPPANPSPANAPPMSPSPAVPPPTTTEPTSPPPSNPPSTTTTAPSSGGVSF